MTGLPRGQAVIIVTATIALLAHNAHNAREAQACRMHNVPVADAVALADALFVGEVVQTKTTVPARRGSTATITVHVRVKSVVAGSVRPLTTRKLTYRELMPIPRRGMRRCPMWIGSGIEFNLKNKQRYYLIVSHNRLIRAVPMAKSKPLLSAWYAQHWPRVSPPRARRATVVLRARIVRNLGGSKYHWTEVHPLKIFKNLSGQTFAGILRIAQYNSSPALSPGTHTLYLEPYSKVTAKHWRLLRGQRSAGATHHQPTVKPAPKASRPSR